MLRFDGAQSWRRLNYRLLLVNCWRVDNVVKGYWIIRQRCRPLPALPNKTIGIKEAT